MTTELADKNSEYGPHSLWATNRAVTLLTSREGRSDESDSVSVAADIDRAEFIAAVEAELDGTFIPDSALPPVTGPGENGQLTCGDFYYTPDSHTPEYHEQRAYMLLALARHLRTQPQVDPAQVDALTAALIEADMDGPDGPTPHAVAMRLLRNPKLSITVTADQED
jgi:hypothetical protein